MLKVDSCNASVDGTLVFANEGLCVRIVKNEAETDWYVYARGTYRYIPPAITAAPENHDRDTLKTLQYIVNAAYKFTRLLSLDSQFAQNKAGIRLHGRIFLH